MLAPGKHNEIQSFQSWCHPYTGVCCTIIPEHKQWFVNRPKCHKQIQITFLLNRRINFAISLTITIYAG